MRRYLSFPSLWKSAILALMMMLAGIVGADQRVSRFINYTEGVMSNDKATSECVTECALPTSDEELRKLLTPEQYWIMKQNGTEAPFKNEYWNNHGAGIYVDRISGVPLFSSKDKFDSGTGWPSFTRPLEDKEVKLIEDASHGMSRVEVRAKVSDSHLGHVFDDGPAPTGRRYCMNSASLRFVAAQDLENQGLGKYAADFNVPLKKDDKTMTELATFGAGCFWGVEETFRTLDGVKNTAVGYEGGAMKNPTYKDVCTDATGHAEVVQVEFDPAKISYDKLLDVFWENHNPTTLNRQGPDVGTQYRSAVFYHSPEQQKAAEASKAKLEASKKFKQPIVTEITPAATFYPAEDYHQKYLMKRGLKACHY